MTCISHWASPLGGITLASDGAAITGLWFDGQAHCMEGVEVEREKRALPAFDEARRWLDIYFEGRDPGFAPPVHLIGTAFQARVWAALREIPYGRFTTYGDLAARLGASARAVGGAVGKNPVSLIVPCHRVLGANGALTGYAGGVDRKRALLEIEGIIDKDAIE